jgi:putative endonuclease
MKNMYVYILQCADDSYYIGVTNDVEKRFKEHQEGFVESCYTFTRRPLQLKFHELFNTPQEAIKFEKQIKKWSRVKKEALINRDWEKLKLLSKSKSGSTSSP